MTAPTPEQAAKIRAYAERVIRGDEPSLAEQAAAARRKRAEELIDSTVNGLSSMQRTAVIEYLSGKNKTEAAAIAGYKNPNKQCTRIFSSKNVRDAIDAFFYAQEMSAGEIVARLSEQGKALYSDFIGVDGKVDLAGLKAAGLMHLVKGTKQTQWGLQVEFYDAHQALVDVARVQGLFKDRTDITSGGEKLEVVVKYAKKDDNPT